MTFRFPNRCKHCREKFTTEELARRLRLHISCIDGYAEAQAAKAARTDAKKARDAAKVDRALTKKRKEAIKTIPDLIKEASGKRKAKCGRCIHYQTLVLNFEVHHGCAMKRRNWQACTYFETKGSK